MTMSVFDVPMHNKSLCLRDPTLLREPLTHTAKDTAHKDNTRIDSSLCPSHVPIFFALLITAVYYTQQTQRDPASLASTMHFYTMAVLPLLIFSRASTSCHRTWHLLAAHVTAMLFAYERVGDGVSITLYMTVVALAVTALLSHHRVHQTTYLLLGACLVLNSFIAAAAYLVHADEICGLYYNLSYIFFFFFMLFI
jgi:hypothetical protein